MMRRSIQNLSALSDEELVRLAKMGNEDAFSTLYERFLPAVYARVRFKVPESDVEDVTQEIFIAVLKSLHTFKGQSKFSTWVRTITNRKIVDFHRSKGAPQVNFQDYENAPAEGVRASHADFMGQQDTLISIQRALGQIRIDYQEILLMRFVEALPFQEIARQNGQSLEATKSLFRRALAALADKMQEENE
jgi:RNA polymerase sigma-70 factor (ECF subfamily)